MRAEEKTIKELKSKGYATLSTTGHKNYDERPDVWILLEVWQGVGEKSLYLDYEWEYDRYHFYFYKNRKEASAKRPKAKGEMEVYNVERYLRGQMPYFPLAKRAARSIAGKKGYYCTEEAEETNAVVSDIENFASLVNWFSPEGTWIGYAFDEDKGMLIIGDYDQVYDALKEMGYESHWDEDEEIEVFDEIELWYC